MKKINFTLAICIILLISIEFAYAQKSKDNSSSKTKDTKAHIEEIQEKCKGLALDKKVRITVARFNSTAMNAPAELGQNMSTMLSSALTQTNCFNVLEEQKNMKDLTNEIDAGNSEYSDASKGIEKGKMLSAQVIVTGEVTDYSIEKSSGGMLGVHSNSEKVHIGFVINMVNPRTREKLYTKTIQVDSKTGAGGSGSLLGLVKVSSNSNSNPAIANALEQGVNLGVEFIADQKDNIPLPNVEDANNILTVVSASNISFPQKAGLLETIKKSNKVKDANVESFSNSVATISVHHSGSSDELATDLYNLGKNIYDIGSVNPGKIALIFK